VKAGPPPAGGNSREKLGKATDKGRRKEPEGQMSKVKQEESSLREKPEPVRPRRLADWINPEGERKVHSSHSFLTTEQTLTFVKAGCGKSARPV
jgi:hypothetical protein